MSALYLSSYNVFSEGPIPEVYQSKAQGPPQSVPAHNLLMNWAEVTCDTTIPSNIYIPPFPVLSAASYMDVKSPSKQPLVFPLSLVKNIFSLLFGDTYPRSSLQLFVGNNPPYYMLKKVRTCTGT